MVSKRFYSNPLVNKWLVRQTINFNILSYFSSLSIFDMVNVHLFHDASNLLAVEQSPSVYSQFRKNALEYTLRRYNGKFSFPIHSNFFVSLPLNPSDASVPYAIFGDFNFRLDAHRLLQVNLSKIDLSI